MRNSYNAVVMVMALLAFAGAAWAQDPAQTVAPSAANDNGARPLMQFAANNADFDKAVTDTATTLYRRQIAACQAADQAVRQLPTPYGGLTFPLSTPNVRFPAPLNGVWAEHVKIRGCGQVYQINLLAVAQPAGKLPVLLALLPGETVSDPGQQGNIMREAAQAIRKADATCSDDPSIIYTRMLGYKQADGALAKKDARLGWFEEWSFNFCKKTVPAQLAFVPDNKGGYDVKARIAGAAPPPAAPAPKPTVQSAAPVPAQPQQTQAP